MLCHLKELGKGSKMLKTVSLYDKRILRYGNLKAFKVSPPEPYFSSKNNPVDFFLYSFFSMQANNLVKWTSCCSKKSYHFRFYIFGLKTIILASE